MATLFLFTPQINEESYNCLSLNEDGQVLAELMPRSFATIKELQQHNSTVVVVPSTQLSLHSVELPWLGEKKARAALPYALEDQLAQAVDNVHVAFARQYYAAGRYLLAVSDKAYLTELISLLQSQGIDFDSITSDWFALHELECCFLSSYAIINHPDFQGALSPELLPLLLANNPQPELHYYRFKDSFTPADNLNATEITEPAALWIAQRLQQGSFINLAQGSLVAIKKDGRQWWYYAAATMAGICLATTIAGNLITLHRLNVRLKEIDNKIAVIYRQFFPQAQQIISPRFRISQLLKTSHSQGEDLLWTLLNTLTKASQKAGSEVERLSFQNNSLQATVVSSDFSGLENLQNVLRQSNIKVKQTQATTRDGKAVSTLELTL